MRSSGVEQYFVCFYPVKTIRVCLVQQGNSGLCVFAMSVDYGGQRRIRTKVSMCLSHLWTDRSTETPVYEKGGG